jgi:hypothetical protein
MVINMSIRDNVAIFKTKTKIFISRGIDNLLLGKEYALVVGWFDIAKLLFFTMLLFVVLGPLMDAGYLYVHHAPAGFYNDSDVSTVDDLYGLYKYIPLVAMTVIIFFIVNYSNLKKNE